MLKKKLMSVGIAVIFTLSSLTTTVFAADFIKLPAGANVTVKFANPGNGKGNDKNKDKDKKANEKKFKFDDSNIDAWAFNAIEKMASKGILGGIGLGKFAPRNKVTQLEALAMVLKLTGDNKEVQSKSTLLHPQYHGIKPTWGLGYLYMAIENKIILPEELSSFNPNTPAKRHEIAKYIIRAIGKTDEALDNMDKSLPFNDKNAVPKKSIGYVYLINELEIMSGTNNQFKPMEPITRSEMAVILDRADGKITLPDTDNKKSNTIFVSVDADDNEITVKVKGTSITYDVLDGVQVYKNGSFETIEDLVEGDVLQLIFNADKEVIFIDVIKNADDADNEDEETELSFNTVDYSNLPEVLQDKVDELKTTKNYKAYEYNDYIYLLTTMGQKNTGGYDIDFENLYKVENDDDFIVKAEIDTDEPSSSSIVTQAITYPYSVVKFRSFNDIDFVRFADDDDDTLADVEIINIDETEADEVSFEAVDYNDLTSTLKQQVDRLKLTKNYKAYEYDNYVYLIATMGQKSSSGYEIDIDSVTSQEYDNRYTIKAVVETDTPSTSDGTTSYPYTIVKFKQFDNINYVRFFDEDNNKLTEVRIVELDQAATVTGTINSINTSSKTIEVKKTNGSVVTLSIPTDAEITVNDDEDESLTDLIKGMKVEIEIIDEIVTKVIAEDQLAEVKGTLTGILLSTVNKITLQVGSTSKTYTVASDVKVIIDDETASVEDLRVSNVLTLRFSNGLLAEIEKE